MAESPRPGPKDPDVGALVRAVGLESYFSQPSLLPQVERFRAGAARLRELDLSLVEPVLVYKPRGGSK